MPNKYVDFVSDEHFKNCVKWVCDAYLDPSLKFDKKKMQRNGIDPFKMVYDIVVRNLDFKSWISREEARQYDKKSGGRIGDFHQKLLGGVSGWTDLGVGDDTKVDLKKDDNTVFMELKNKHNTVNSDSLSAVRQKLEKITNDFPNSTAYWAYVIEKNGTSGESEWNYLGDKNPKLKKIWGSKLYEMITGKKDALEKTWELEHYYLIKKILLVVTAVYAFYSLSDGLVRAYAYDNGLLVILVTYSKSIVVILAIIFAYNKFKSGNRMLSP